MCSRNGNANKPNRRLPAPPTDNTKVKVQYVQNNKVGDKTPVKKSDVDNLVDESAAQATNESAKEPIFSKNALHYLVMIYGNKYADMLKQGACAEPHIWEVISKNMTASMFSFEPDQLRRKFQQMRQTYFQAKSKEDTKSCEYFKKMHGIYADPRIKSLLSGDNHNNAESPVYIDEELFQEEVVEEESPIEYVENREVSAPITEEVKQKQADEISVSPGNVIQKLPEIPAQAQQDDDLEEPPEYTDEMMLLQQEEIVQTDEMPTKHATSPILLQHLQQPLSASLQQIFVKHEEQTQNLPQVPSVSYPHIKRAKMGVQLSAGVPTEMLTQPTNQPTRLILVPKSPQPHHLSSPPMQRLQHTFIQPLLSPGMATSSSAAANAVASFAEFSPISLATYNDAQERRHREKMDLIRRSLALQESSIEVQRLLIEQLRNRSSGDHQSKK